MFEDVFANGSITTIVGAMAAGKTEKLIETYREAKEKGLNVSVFKPLMDSRSQVDRVESRNGNTAPATAIDSLMDIVYNEDEENPYDIVLIDESQFFLDPKDLHVLEGMAIVGIDVYLFGLDMTSEKELFGQMGDVMGMSDDVIKLKAKCTECGDEARYTFYKEGNKSNDIEVGDLDVYDSLCRVCYHTKQGEKSVEVGDNVLCFQFKLNDGEPYSELYIDKEELEKSGYTPEDVRDINSIEGYNNLLVDLGVQQEDEENE